MNDSSASEAVIVFLKKPELGRAKTRIGNVIGHPQALEIYKQLLDLTFEVLSQVEAVKLRYFFPERFERSEWPSQATRDFIQSGSDLGERMQQAFQMALEQYPKVLIVGTDCPYITPDLIHEAFAALDEHDTVIGPSKDGGYYLLGMKELIPQIFRDIPWSTDEVYPLTRRKLDALEKSTYLLPELRDIDFIEDWEEYLKSQG